MHYDIQLRKNGRLFRMEWSAKDKIYIERELNTDEIEQSLYCTVCIAPNTRLGDLLRLVSNHIDIFGIVIGCQNISAFLEEAYQEAPDGAGEDLVSVELEWTAVLDDEDGELVLLQQTNFYGQAEDGSTRALEFTPINHLYEVPFFVNDALRICDNNNPEKVLLSALRPMTLFEVVSGVMNELMFFGSPQERNESLEKIREGCRELTEGKYETHTLDDIQKKLRVEAEKNRKKFPCRLCQQDARCACFNKPHDLCHKCFIKMEEN